MSDVWVGLVEVSPGLECAILEGGKGAFVNAFVFAAGQREYERKVTAALVGMGFHVLEFQDVEPFSARAAASIFFERHYELADRARLADDVCLDDFYIYENLDG